ncbi:MAG: DUF2924 domain-containing protein [Alphaproteobacteria bacterium]|nr:DUF2924 domain-containing protein [Alphaproteobacteria bacterium]
MQKNQLNQIYDNTITGLPLADLRRKWAEYWGVQPHGLIGRTMLEKSLEFRLKELETGGLAPDQQMRLDLMIKAYKRNSRCFDDNEPQIKPGTRLVRMHGGVRHSVLVQAHGYEYQGTVYRSLSQVATLISGCRRNGWDFFGLKRKGGAG